MNFWREIAPMGVFFIIYNYYGLMEATLVLSFLMSGIIIYDFFILKKLQMQMLVSTILLVVFGAISFITGDTSFIKIKVTLINLLFGIVLLVGTYYNKAFVKYLFNSAIQMGDSDWLILSRRFGYYFCFLSILNEIIWRNFSESTWVSFKTFGFLIISIAFILTQFRFITQVGHVQNSEN